MPPLDPSSGAIFAVVAVAVGLATSRRPVWGAVALVLLDPFDFSHTIGPTTVTVTKVALIGSIVGLVARRVSLCPLRSAEIRPLGLGILAIVGATALAATQADYHTPALREALKAVEYALIFGSVLVAFASDPDERFIDNALVAIAIVVAFAALVQTSAGRAPSAIYLGARVVPRIAGPLEGPNQLAGYFDVMVPLLLALALARGRAKPLVIVALAIAAGADVLTFSRAGLAAALAAATIVVAVARPHLGALRILGATGVVGFVALGAFGAMGMLSRFTNWSDADRPTGLGTRSELWHAALTLWRKHQWLGVGGGNYELELPRAGVTDAQTHANSLYLQSLAEGGILLFAAVVGTIVGACAVMWRHARAQPFALGALGATVALALHQVFDLMVFYPKVGGFWWIALGLGAGAIVVEKSKAGDAHPSARAA